MNMTDSLLAQREARRQKLMKNAESRLNRLRARPQSESDDLPSPDIELHKIDNSQQLETDHGVVENDYDDELRTTSPYNLRHRTRNSPPNDGIKKSTQSEAKSPSIPYEIVEDPEVPSLAEFLAKKEASKTTNPNNGQQAFNANILPPKRLNNDLKRREMQVEYIRVIGLFLTALLSRINLSYDFGTDFFLFGSLFRSMFFPLMLFEVVISYAFKRFMPGVSTAPPQGSLLTTALMLCGLKPELIQLYIRIMSRVTALSNDLFLYIFAFLLWHIVLGF